MAISIPAINDPGIAAAQAAQVRPMERTGSERGSDFRQAFESMTQVVPVGVAEPGITAAPARTDAIGSASDAARVASTTGRRPETGSNTDSDAAQTADARQADRGAERTGRDVDRSAGTDTASQASKADADAAQAVDDAAAQDMGDATETKEESGTAWAAAATLLDDAADALDVTAEELIAIMGSLGMQPEALLDPQSVNQLAAAALGDGDALSILTDGTVYDAAAAINEAVGETVTQLMDALPELSDEEVQAAFAESLDDVATRVAPLEAGESVGRMESRAIEPAAYEDVTAAQPVDDAAASMAVQAIGEDGAEDAQKGDVGEEARDARGARGRERREERLAEQSGDIAPTFVPEAQPTDAAEAVRPEEPLPYSTRAQEILDQVADHIKAQVKEDMTSLDMVLHPASLGAVALRVASQNGQVTAQFTAQNENVREALEAQVMQLKQNLEQQGVKVEAVEVTVASHAFEQNLEQGDAQSDAQDQERERLRRATHRINLGDFAGEGAEGVEDADALTIEMMQADGQRLNYRA